MHIVPCARHQNVIRIPRKILSQIQFNTHQSCAPATTSAKSFWVLPFFSCYQSNINIYIGTQHGDEIWAIVKSIIICEQILSSLEEYIRLKRFSGKTANKIAIVWCSRGKLSSQLMYNQIVWQVEALFLTLNCESTSATFIVGGKEEGRVLGTGVTR